MFREAEEMDLPRPEILEIGMRVRFFVYFLRSFEIYGTNAADQRPELFNGSVLSEKILIALKEEDLSMSKLAVSVGHITVSGELKKQVRNLLDCGFIERTIPEKPGSRNQKYRLTKKGENLFDYTRIRNV